MDTAKLLTHETEKLLTLEQQLYEAVLREDENRKRKLEEAKAKKRKAKKKKRLRS